MQWGQNGVMDAMANGAWWHRPPIPWLFFYRTDLQVPVASWASKKIGQRFFNNPYNHLPGSLPIPPGDMKPHIGGFHIIQGLRHLFRTRLLVGKELIQGFGDFLANVNIKKSIKIVSITSIAFGSKPVSLYLCFFLLACGLEQVEYALKETRFQGIQSIPIHFNQPIQNTSVLQTLAYAHCSRHQQLQFQKETLKPQFGTNVLEHLGIN